MKKRHLIFTIFTFAFAVLLIRCTEDTETPETVSILPTSFNVEVPSSLASSSGLKAGDLSINGNDLYEMMRAFVFVGHSSAAIIHEFIGVIALYQIDRPMEFTYISGDDNRAKELIVTANETFENIEYEYKMVVRDIQNPLSPATGLEMYWNRSHANGVAIMQFYNLNRTDTKNTNARIRIDYSESSSTYDKQMIVAIAGLDIDGVNDNVDNLKMFVGKKGDLLDVYGNANLPDYQIIDQTHQNGYNWAFVAHVDDSKNISVAKVALPPTTVSNNTDLFTIYAMKKVLEEEIQTQYPLATQTLIDQILENSAAPAYFNANGFISCGDAIPAGFSTEFINLSGMNTYTPVAINALQIPFSDEEQIFVAQ